MYLGKLSKKEKKDECIWEVILLVCFQNDESLKSALEVGYLYNTTTTSTTSNNNNNKHWQNYYLVEILNCIYKTD